VPIQHAKSMPVPRHRSHEAVFLRLTCAAPRHSLIGISNCISKEKQR
jgi:hypothetical protein